MARRLSCRQSVVWSWANKGRVPSTRIPQIIEAAAQLDPPAHLRPNDFFDAPVRHASCAATVERAA